MKQIMKTCENCGCKVYSKGCVNCNEENYILEQYYEQGIKTPNEETEFIKKVLENEKKNYKHKNQIIMEEQDLNNLEFEEDFNELKKYFCIEEFVSPEVFNKYGETSWQFICPRLLRTILWVRTNLDKPMTINNWKWGGNFTQRGLRENISHIVASKTKSGKLYLSAHTMGKAVDFDVKGMEAEEVRIWLKEHAEELPYHIRLEHHMKGKPISWVHLDVFFNPNNPKVYLFDV